MPFAARISVSLSRHWSISFVDVAFAVGVILRDHLPHRGGIAPSFRAGTLVRAGSLVRAGTACACKADRNDG